MKKWWRARRRHIYGPAIYWITRMLGMTLRIQVVGYEQFRTLDRSKIYAGWHGKSLVAALFFRKKGVWTIISNSNDGEMQNWIFKRFGFNTVRGSSGRGGARVLIECVRILRQNIEMAFTPDGPRGPSEIVQEGITIMALKSGAVMVPVGVAASRCWRVKTWDRYMIPKPFSRAIMVFGAPIVVPENATSAELESYRTELETKLNEMEREAELAVGAK